MTPNLRGLDEGFYRFRDFAAWVHRQDPTLATICALTSGEIIAPGYTIPLMAPPANENRFSPMPR